MSELVRRDERDSWVDVLGPVGDLAGRVVGTEFVPASLRDSKSAVAACILTGREIGLGPMTSLQGIYVVNGRPTLSAQLMRSLVFAAGHRIRYLETSSTRCVVAGYRKGDEQPTATVTATIEEAAKAGLGGKDTWKKHPRQMLEARATSELCRLAFPDVIAGLGYTDDEVEDVEPGETDAAPTTAKVSRRRKNVTVADDTRTATGEEPGVQRGLESPDNARARAASDAGTSGSAAAATVTPDDPPLDDPEPEALLAQELGAQVVEVRDPAVRTLVQDVPGPDDIVDAELVFDPPPDTEAAPPDDGDQAATRLQVGKLNANITDLGWTIRDDKLRAISTIIGRPIKSSNDLTKREASELIEVTAHALAADDPPARFEEILTIARGERL